MDGVQDIIMLSELLCLFEQEQSRACDLAQQSWDVIIQMLYDHDTVDGLRLSLADELNDAGSTTWRRCLRLAMAHLEESAAVLSAHA